MNLFDQVLDIGRDIVERRVRLGVTGLSDAGKTVFITALVHALLQPARLTRLRAVAEGRYHTGILRPQPSHDLPRFPYEACVERLTGAGGAPEWPESTRSVAELRVSIRYRPRGLMGRLGDNILHLDLFDYPGEWLLDLALMDKDFETWSREVIAEARTPGAAREAAPWLDYLDTLDPDAPDRAAESAAMEAAARFTAYLHASRDRYGRSALIGPGRFLLPGELEGSPLVTFCPISPSGSGERGERNSLRRLMRERYRAYQDQVVGAFHRRHFARLDSQVVLVDIAGHASRSGAALDPVARSLDSVLSALKIGSGGWLPRWISPSIEKVLFAASKADQVPTDQHEALDALLRRSLGESIRRTSYRGAQLETFSLAAIRATREVVAKSEERRYVAGRTLGQDRDIAHFPGRLDATASAGGGFEVVRFLPPPGLDPAGPWPHLRLDRAIETLIGDRLS